MAKIRIKSEISNIFIIKFDKNIADLYFFDKSERKMNHMKAESYQFHQTSS